MVELVPDPPAGPAAGEQQKSQRGPRPSATIHYIYDGYNPPLNAIISVARRLQEVLIQHGALPEGGALPFPALAPIDHT